MRVACEACGAPDSYSRELLLRQGLREWPDVPAHRPPLLCANCRGTLILMIQSLRQEAAEADVVREREQGGLPPPGADELSRAAEKRWRHQGADVHIAPASALPSRPA